MDFTREQIEKMTSGREMDALLAERVMGFCLRCRNTALMNDGFTGQGAVIQDDGSWKCGRHNLTIDPQEPSPYSTDIGTAWLVVERLREQGKSLVITTLFLGEYHISNTTDEGLPVTGWSWDEEFNVRCDTLPLAIGKAALLAALESAAGAD